MASNTETSRFGCFELGEGNNQSEDIELGDTYSRGNNNAVKTMIASGKYSGSFHDTPNSPEEKVSFILSFTGSHQAQWIYSSDVYNCRSYLKGKFLHKHKSLGVFRVKTNRAKN